MTSRRSLVRVQYRPPRICLGLVRPRMLPSWFGQWPSAVHCVGVPVVPSADGQDISRHSSDRHSDCFLCHFGTEVQGHPSKLPTRQLVCPIGSWDRRARSAVFCLGLLILSYAHSAITAPRRSSVASCLTSAYEVLTHLLNIVTGRSCGPPQTARGRPGSPAEMRFLRQDPIDCRPSRDFCRPCLGLRPRAILLPRFETDQNYRGET